MVEGIVNARLEAIVNLTLSGPSGREREIDAVVDTGYTEFLTLSPKLVAELRLDFVRVDFLVLADGSVETFHVFELSVMWDGRPTLIEAHQANSIPLVGMGLLHHNSLFVEVVEGGRVVVQPLK